MDYETPELVMVDTVLRIVLGFGVGQDDGPETFTKPVCGIVLGLDD